MEAALAGWIMLYNLYMAFVKITSQELNDNLPHITIGVVTDYKPEFRKQNGQDLNINSSVIWAVQNSTERYRIIETAHSLEKYGANIILFALSVPFHEILKSNTSIKVPMVSVDRLYRYGVPTNICITHNFIDSIMETRRKIDYLSLDEDGKSQMIKGAVESLFKKIGWTTVVIFYDSYTASLVESLSDRFTESGISTMKYNFDNLTSESALDDTLNILYTDLYKDGLNITLVCKLSCIKTILYRANLYDSVKENKRKTAMHQNSRWFVLSILNEDMESIKWKTLDLDNVVLLNFECLPLPESHNIIIKQRLVDLRLEMDNLLCDRTVDNNITSPELFLHELQAIIQDLDTLTNSYTDKLFFNVYTLLWYRHERGFSIVGKVGITGKIQIHSEIYPNIHHGFNGRKFLVTTLLWPPFVMRKEKNGTTEYYGFCIDLLKELATSLNFTYELTEPADKEWGRLRPNNTWTGMIGQLENEKVDLMVAPNSIQVGRELVMDFTYPFFFDTTAFIVKRPDPNRNKWRTLIDPLSWPVLVCVAVALPTCAFVLFIVERYSPYFILSKEKPHDYQYALWYMLGALLTQGGENPPSSQSGRTLISFWWIFSIILVATYSGNLIAYLTVTKEKLPFNTFEELSDQTDYIWGICGGTYIVTHFQTSPLPTFRKLWQGIERALPTNPEILDIDPNVHLKKVLNEDYAFFCDYTYFEVLTASNCNFVIAEEQYPNMNYGVGLPNNSPYTKLFSTKVLELLESGIFQIWKETHWPKQNFCKGSAVTEAKKITLIDVQSAFYLIGIGVTFAFIILFTECIISRLKICHKCLPHSKKQTNSSVYENNQYGLKDLRIN